MFAGICAMTTSGFLLGLPRADTLPGRPAYPSLQPMPRAARASKTTAAVVMQNSDEPPEDLMSMDQHELETAHSRALIDAHDLKRSVLLLDYDDECTALARGRAKFNDAMESAWCRSRCGASSAMARGVWVALRDPHFEAPL